MMQFSRFDPDPTDAYPALVAAIAEATRRHKSLRIDPAPGGAPWHVRFLPGRAAIWITCSLSGDAALHGICTNPSLYTMWRIEAGALSVSDLTFDGGRVAQDWDVPSPWAVVSIRGCTGVTLDGVTVKRGQKWGIDAFDCERLTIKDSTFELCGWYDEPPGNSPVPSCGGLRMASSAARSYAVMVKGSQFSQNAGQGLSITGADYVTVADCIATGNGLYEAHGNQDGIHLADVIGATVTRCGAVANLADGIVVTSATGQASSKVVISGNTSERNGGNGILLWCDPAGAGGGISDARIERNLCYDNSQMSPANWPHGFDGIRLSPWGNRGGIRGVTLARNTCTGISQMHGIGQPPREVDPAGGLEDIKQINNLADGYHGGVGLWEVA